MGAIWSPGTGYVLDANGSARNVVEPITGGVIVTESDHTAIHKGYGFKGVLEITNLAGAQSLSWSLNPATDGSYVHFKNLKLTALGASCKVEILENVDITVDNGTAVALPNLNALSQKDASTVIKASPTYANGNVMDMAVVLMDSTNQFVGSANSASHPYEEIVLNPGDSYVIKVTNLSAATAITKAFVQFFFYEEPAGLI